jgi:glycine cleavage system aminomethyltransferase T
MSNISDYIVGIEIWAECKVGYLTSGSYSLKYKCFLCFAMIANKYINIEYFFTKNEEHLASKWYIFDNI